MSGRDDGAGGAGQQATNQKQQATSNPPKPTPSTLNTTIPSLILSLSP